MHDEKIIRYGMRAMGILLMAVECYFLVRGGARAAVDEWDKMGFIALAAALSLGISFLPSAAFTLFRKGRMAVGCFACIAWAFFALYAWGTTVSVSAINHAEVQSAREASIVKATYTGDAVAEIERKLKKLEEELNFLPVERPPQTIAAEIDGLKQSKRWGATSGCTNATTGRSRTYCKQYFALKAEMDSSGRRIELQGLIETTARDLASARSVAMQAKPHALANANPENAILASIVTLNRNPGEDAVWATEMGRYANMAFILLASAIVNLVATALNAGKGGGLVVPTSQVASTENVRLETPEPVSVSPYMATKASVEPSLTDKFVNVAEELRRRFAFRPTGPSAPMIEAAA